MRRDERLRSLIRERLGAFEVRSQSAAAVHGAASPSRSSTKGTAPSSTACPRPRNGAIARRSC